MTAVKFLTDARGVTWKQGQAARVPKFQYTGSIVALWPATATAKARAWVCEQGDNRGRTVTLDQLEAA